MRNKTEDGRNVTLEKLLEDIRAAVRDGEELLKAGATGVKRTAVEKAAPLTGSFAIDLTKPSESFLASD